MSDPMEIEDPRTAQAMQAIYDRIRELGGSPALIASADRVAARIRNEEQEK